MRGNISIWYSYNGLRIETHDSDGRIQEYIFPYKLVRKMKAFNEERLQELRRESHAFHYHKEDDNDFVCEGNIPTKYFDKNDH